MELNFPSPATTGTVYTGTNSVTYIYDGLKWSGQIPVQSDLDTGLIHYYDDQLQARPTGDVVIATDSGNWTFSSTGTTQFPNNTLQAPAGNPLEIKSTYGNAYSKFEIGDVYASIGIQDDTTGANQAWAYFETDMSDVNDPSATVIVKPGDTGNEVHWTFSADGNLTLPGDLISNNQSIKFISTTTDHTSYTVTDNTIKFGNISNSTVTWDIVTNNNSTGFTNTRLEVPTSTANTNTYVSFSSPSNTTVLQNSELINQMPGGKPGFSVISSDKISLVTGINAVAGTGSAGGLNGIFGWTWTFGSDGRLTLPEGGSIADTTSSLVISASNGSVPGYPSTPGSSSWYFGVDGSLTFPDATKQTTAWTGTVSYSNVADIPIFTTSTLYKGTATLTLGSTGIVTLFRGSTIQDTITHGIAIGLNAGTTNHGAAAIALGYGAGYNTQGTNGIAIGENAGRTSQGSFGIAIGYEAGKVSQHANSTVINATGATLNSTTASSFYVKPVRSVSTTTGLKQVWYDPTTGEFVYYTP
jgi:hypothetical protein